MIAPLLRALTRALTVVLLVMLASTVLVRLAPGYLSDTREMDAQYSGVVRTELAIESARSRSVTQMFAHELVGWTHGDAGVSRQFGIPVLQLLRPRLAVTANLLLRSIALAWILALGASLIAATRKNSGVLWQTPATLLLAVPTAAMATLCLLIGSGGPVLVMALLLAARDFKFLQRILRQAWFEPHLLHARAQGISTRRLLAAHVAPAMLAQLAALAGLSIVTALSALVPVEVLFDVPGLGQLAWNAALNRDLPVLLAVTLIMAIIVVGSGMLKSGPEAWERA